MKKLSFIDFIGKLKEQFDYDIAYQKTLTDALKAEGIEAYGNQVLYEAVVEMLAMGFEKSFEAKEMMLEFMFAFNFGREKSARIKSADELYDFLAEECNLKTCKFKN